MLDIFQNPTKYNKFWIALTAAVLAILGRHLGLDNPYYLDAVTLAGVLGVVLTPNKQ